MPDLAAVWHLLRLAEAVRGGAEIFVEFVYRQIRVAQADGVRLYQNVVRPECGQLLFNVFYFSRPCNYSKG